MKKLLLVVAITWISNSCKKIPESQYQCHTLKLTLPEGWSFDFANNDFTTLPMVDSSWSFSPKSWSGTQATGRDAGAELIILMGDMKTNSTLKNLQETSGTLEKDVLVLFFDEYSNQYNEHLKDLLKEPKQEKYSSGTWYVFTKIQQNIFEEEFNNYLLQILLKIHDGKLYMIYIKDFEENFDINRKKYFDKILHSIKFT